MSVICHIMTNLQYYSKNYVDDFMGIELQQKAWQAYNSLGCLLRDLGIKEAGDKAVPPTTVIEFLGTGFNLNKLVMFVIEGRMQLLMQELQEWVDKTTMTCTQLESIADKLQAISHCVRPARVFVSRLFNKIPRMRRHTMYTVDDTTVKDLRWLQTFLPTYNGMSIMWLEQMMVPDVVLATDACLTGIVGQCGTRYYHSKIPQEILQWPEASIAHFEMVAVMTALKLWSQKLHGIRFKILCDNQAVVSILNTGKSRDVRLQQLQREIVFLQAQFNFELRSEYITTKQNRIPDLLSRYHLEYKYRSLFGKEKQPDAVEDKVTTTMFNITNSW